MEMSRIKVMVDTRATWQTIICFFFTYGPNHNLSASHGFLSTPPLLSFKTIPSAEGCSATKMNLPPAFAASGVFHGYWLVNMNMTSVCIGALSVAFWMSLRNRARVLLGFLLLSATPEGLTLRSCYLGRLGPRSDQNLTFSHTCKGGKLSFLS